MKKNTKIAISFIVLLALIVSGCASGGQSNNASSQTSSPSPNSSSPSSSGSNGDNADSVGYQEGAYTLPIVSEPTEFVVMFRDSSEPGKSFNTSRPIAWDLTSKQTGITFKYDVVPSKEYTQMMQLRLSSNKDLPDILALQGDQDGAFLNKYAEEGIVIPLNDLIDKYAPNIKRVFEEYPNYKRNLTLSDGNIYSIGDLNASLLNLHVPFIRKDWLDQYNLEVKSADDLMAAVRTFMNNDPNNNGQKDEYGFMAESLFGYKQLGMMFGLHLATGQGWKVIDGKVSYDFISPKYKEYLEWMHTAYKEGFIPKDFQTVNADLYNERNAKNQVGINVRYPLRYFVEFNAPGNSVQTNTPGAIWQPIIFEGSEVEYVLEPEATVWRTYGITKNAKDPIAAIRLLDYMFAGEGRYQMLFGEEGVHFNMVNGIPVAVDNYRELIGSDEFLGVGYNPVIQTTEMQEAMFEAEYLNADPAKKEWTVNLANEVKKRTVASFQAPIPTAEDAAIVSQLSGDFITYRDEMFVKFITGDVPMSEFDNYVRNMKSLGADTIAAIYQKNLDR